MKTVDDFPKPTSIATGAKHIDETRKAKNNQEEKAFRAAERELHRASSIFFGEVVNALSSQARRHGLSVPVFRSPPRIIGVTRTIYNSGEDKTVVAIATRQRANVAVVSDVIEGILESNSLDLIERMRSRELLWEASLPYIFQTSESEEPHSIDDNVAELRPVRSA